MAKTKATLTFAVAMAVADVVVQFDLVSDNSCSSLLHGFMPSLVLRLLSSRKRIIYDLSI